MRKEPFFVNDFVHVYNRGNRKQEIVRDELDCKYFLQALRYFNTEQLPANPFQELRKLEEKNSHFKIQEYPWPPGWPEHKPLVKIFGFILLRNHFHFLLQEIREGGTTAFMRKFGTGMANRFNTRYGEVGRLFQGSYKAKRVDSENYLRYLSVYIHVKNAFEMYPKGAEHAVENFDDAYAFAARYPYGSLALYTGRLTSPLIDVHDDMLPVEIFSRPEEYKEFARSCVPFMNFDEKKCLLNI